ncbi:hypothetical protein [Phenylobacterium sp.]|uniref:hypothetical protein n=1 Tax=Phenylobacterium sp. TaxID=1871053 RepID=UPI001200DF5E|nr:hypothetical protein [Phenylobacterium sp.]THD57446.1 MAG: hypothetical protein E8A49_22645 [Phenylobacterium sp.]
MTEFQPRSHAAVDLQRLLVEAGERIARNAGGDRENPAYENRSFAEYSAELDDHWRPSLPMVAAGSALWGDIL